MLKDNSRTVRAYELDLGDRIVNGSRQGEERTTEVVKIAVGPRGCPTGVHVNGSACYDMHSTLVVLDRAKRSPAHDT